jgi:hypothetical protein
MAQTPYELRFNYYMAAKAQLIDQYHAEFNQAQVEADKGKSVEYPHFPSSSEIFTLAEEIKSFAEKR